MTFFTPTLRPPWDGQPLAGRRGRRRPVALTVAVQLLASLLLGLGVLALGGGTANAAGAPSGLHVSGSQLLTGSGALVVMRGVDRSGSEYACIQNFGFFDGPTDNASIAAMAGWHINTVRVPLNEDCWLGINNAPAAYSGAAYRSAIGDYVTRLRAAGLMVILDLHWTAAGTAQSTGQQQMPDADHAPAFWTSVATTFKTDTSTVFDLFNEPYGVTWSCWRDGGDCGIGYQVAGMQTLVTAVRNTGATNPVLLGGLAYANDLSSWPAYRPTDPASQEMASWHSYNFNACNTSSCWNSQIAPVAASVPLVTGELGENDCAHGYVDGAMAWLDAHNAGYLGWGWNTANCSSFPALVSDYTGTPTPYGAGLHDHLAALAATSPAPTPTPSSSATHTTGTTPTSSASSPTPTSAPSGTAASPTTPRPTTSPAASPTPVVSSPAGGCAATTPASSAPASSTPSATVTVAAPPANGGSSPAGSSAPAPGGSFSVSPSVNTSSAPYWGENGLAFSASAPITQLTVTVTVARTTGISYAGSYSTGPNGAVALGHTDSGSTVTYTATLNSGNALPANTTVIVGSQYNGTGAAHPTSGDTFTVSAVVGGQNMTSSGHF